MIEIMIAPFSDFFIKLMLLNFFLIIFSSWRNSKMCGHNELSNWKCRPFCDNLSAKKVNQIAYLYSTDKWWRKMARWTRTSILPGQVLVPPPNGRYVADIGRVCKNRITKCSKVFILFDLEFHKAIVGNERLHPICLGWNI